MSYLYIKWVYVFNWVAGNFVLVVIYTQKVEQVLLVVSVARPEDEDLGFLDGRRAFVFQVVDVNHFLAELILDIILQSRGQAHVNFRDTKADFKRFFQKPQKRKYFSSNLGGQGGRLVVFDESWLRGSCHATVGGHTDGHKQVALVVLQNV